MASSPIGSFTLTLFCLLPFFQLLTIFVSGKLASYMKFYQNNKDFIDSLGKWHHVIFHKFSMHNTALFLNLK